MISWGTITVGGIAFREQWSVDEQGDGQLTISGSPLPTDSEATTKAMHHAVLGLSEQPFVPATFSDKASLNGFYRVGNVASFYMRQPGVAAATTARWEIPLTRLGNSSDVELESRVPTIARSTTVSSPPAPVFWHAPAVGTSTYFTGATVPGSSITRTGSEGAVPVHLSIPAGVVPRWTSTAEAYLGGSVRLLLDGVRRLGTATPPHATWELNNSLVRVTPGASGSFDVACWSGGGWKSAKGYQVAVNGTAVTATPEFTVLRNEPGEVTVRLTFPSSPGRVTVDLGLRRGSRFVTGVVKRHAAASLAVVRTAAETAAAATGGLRATAADGDGNRFVMGSAATVTTATGTASITRASATAFDFFVGHEVGATPGTGDAFANLFAQYLGTSGDATRVVRR